MGRDDDTKIFQRKNDVTKSPTSLGSEQLPEPGGKPL